MITALPRIAVAVRDMDRAIATFRDGFGLPVHEFAGLDATLGIRMALCAPRTGSHIELMSPADPARALAKSLGRFLDRRGEGLFALMLYAPDPNAEAADLERRGLEVMPLMEGAGGRDIHPKNTHGVLIRIYPSGTAAAIEQELDRALGKSSSRRSRSHLSGIRRVIVAVNDLDDAVAAYRDRLGIAAEVRDDATLGVRFGRCRPNAGAEIDLVEARASEGSIGALAAHAFRDRGEGMVALVLGSDDLEATTAALRQSGIRLRALPGNPALRETDPPTAHGARVWIEATG